MGFIVKKNSAFCLSCRYTGIDLGRAKMVLSTYLDFLFQIFYTYIDFARSIRWGIPCFLYIFVNYFNFFLQDIIFVPTQILLSLAQFLLSKVLCFLE
jgi:hypothetical protein